MATGKITAADAKAIEEFDFAIGEPPAFAITRKSKHAERWAAAMTVAKNHPGKFLKMITYPGSKGSAGAGTLAAAINNNERKEFITEDGQFSCKKAKDNIEGTSYSVWLKFEPNAVEELNADNSTTEA